MARDKLRSRTWICYGLTKDAAADWPWTGHGQVTDMDIVADNGADTSGQIATDSRMIEPCSSKG